MTRTHEMVGDAPECKACGGEAPVSKALPGEPACLAPGGAAALVDGAFRVLEGRWKLAIVFRLFAEPVRRFSELERAIPGVSQKMLAQQLRELERDGLVLRTIYPEVPPRVEYRLTVVGEALRPALAALRAWATVQHGQSAPDA